MTEEDREVRAENASPDGESHGDAEADLVAAKQALETELESVKQEAADLKDRWIRSAADFENYKKRQAREREDIQKFANEKLLKDLLPVVDDLDRAVDVVANSGANEQVQEGVQMVRRKFLGQLEKNGVLTFEALGQSFDPNFHEAVQQAHSNDVPAGQVLSELQRGFTINGRLLRPALVIVSLGAQQ